jgi:hypothetical protein
VQVVNHRLLLGKGLLMAQEAITPLRAASGSFRCVARLFCCLAEKSYSTRQIYVFAGYHTSSSRTPTSSLPGTPGVVPSGGYASRTLKRTALQVARVPGRSRYMRWGPTARPIYR